MKIRRDAIALAAAVSAFIAAGCRSAPTVAAASGEWTSARLGIVFALPEGAWSVAEGEDGLHFRRAGGAIELLVRTTRQPGASGRDPGVLARELLLDFEKKQVLARRGRTLLGQPAACIAAEAEVKGRAVHLEVCSAALHGAVLDAACWAPPEEADAARRLFDAFLDGMRPAAAPGDPGATPGSPPAGGAGLQGRP